MADRPNDSPSDGPGGASAGRPGAPRPLRPARSGRLSTRLTQVLLVGIGLVLAVVMTGLGLWQMNVFESQRANTAQARAGQPPVVWDGTTARRDQVGEVYGRRIQVTGHYLKDTQVLVGTSSPLRVVTGLQMTSGEVIPVVRGEVTATEKLTAPPSGQVTLTGVLLASDAQPSDFDSAARPSASAGSGVASGSVPMQVSVLPALRLEVLAQSWPEPIVPGYLTASRQDAAREGLPAATAPLPETDGGARNRSYALQWWAFAAFALGMSIVFARTVGTRASQPGRRS